MKTMTMRITIPAVEQHEVIKVIMALRVLEGRELNNAGLAQLSRGYTRPAGVSAGPGSRDLSVSLLHDEE